MLVAWSALTVDASMLPTPLATTATRGPSCPRMIGRPTPGPKLLVCTPGMRAMVSPRVASLRASSSSPASTATGLASDSASLCSGEAVTLTVDSSVR